MECGVTSCCDDIVSSSSNLRSLPFDKMINALASKGWSIDIRAIDKNILHISRDDEEYIFYIYYGQGGSDAWLADEEKFEGESPLWFS